MSVIRSPRTTEAAGEIEIKRGTSTSLRWSEVTVRVFDASDAPVSEATGTLTGQVLKTGSGKRQDFQNPLNLVSDDWSFTPELSTVRSFFFSISGLNAGYTYQITVNSWNP